ncbi:FAS1-like dehydratase domain-containing protein [Puniceibacterium sediminis]|uniref:3-methylfumaryl-CoA hydratase n=1 Tax=Puniceibacterium sediminis TaxID=1608407 RepID=A0A238VWJ5_9RHOB|nr:MaoC family dehydratase N-terminal domain-containing protein [Puniceibacterium sediminis]SNR38507.1 3-methylfumaryl-CoA hydratase [Puniceibacterium sediminis]
MSDAEWMIRQSDVLDPARAQALQAALGLEPDAEVGTPLPPFFHQIYFWEPQPPELLGRDGHPRVGSGLIPDMGLPRRMWAGGRLRFDAPLLAGIPAVRRSRVLRAEHKTGRSGPLAFVTLRHEIVQDRVVVVQEDQDLVYRTDPEPGAPRPQPPRPQPPQARRDEAEAREVAFDATLLFRYSALTFNGHRIHYDETYARDVEGYTGLVVHGPLLAQMLMLMADSSDAPLRGFEFRATAPLMHTERATLCRSGLDAWVRGPDGRQCLVAAITT